MNYTTKDIDEASEIVEEIGFCLLEDVFSEEYLEPRRQLAADVLESRNSDVPTPFESMGYEEPGVDRGTVTKVFQRYPPFQDMTKREEILDVCEDVLGRNVCLFESVLLSKPKYIDNEVRLHRDYPSLHDSSLLNAWMALEDVPREKGCLKMVRNSHREDPPAGEEMESYFHPDESDFDESAIEYVEMEAGDVLFWDLRLAHGSDNVAPDSPRYAYRSTYYPLADEIDPPGFSPIMMRGGDPDSLIADGTVETLSRYELMGDDDDADDEQALRELFVQFVKQYV